MSMPGGTGQGADGDATLGSDAGVGPVSAGQSDTMSSVSVDQTGESAPSTDGDSNPEIKLRDEWNPILQVVPEQFHPEMARTLKQWDRNYSMLDQKFAPYRKAFADKGITAEDLQGAHQLYQMLNTNPQEVFRRMATAFVDQGTDLNSLLPENYRHDANSSDPDDDYESEETQEVSPQIQQLQQQLQLQQQQFQEYTQGLQYQEQVKQAEQEIDREVKQILQQDPNVDVQDLLSRYSNQINMAARGQYDQPSIQNAYKEQQAFIQKYTQGQNRAAPRIIPGGSGGAPSETPGSSTKTQEDRINRASALINAAKQG